MAPPIPPSTGPTPEALTLAATLFHADVDAWLPKNFGVTRSAEAKEAEWAAARSAGLGGDRLGVGHPHLADPEARRAAASARAGGDILRKVVGKKRKDDEADAAAAGAGGSGGRGRGDDSDDESRTRAVSSKKRRVADAFGSGKKKKGKAEPVVHPLLNIKNPIPGYDAPLPAAPVKAVEKKKVEVDDSVNAAAALAASLTSGSASGGARMSVVAQAKKVEVATTEGKREDEVKQAADDAPMSKAALRREKRKRAKAKKAT